MQLARYAERLAIVSSVSRATSLRFVSRSVGHKKRFRAIEENAEFEAPLRFDTDNAESAESATTPLAPTDPTESRNLTIKDIPPVVPSPYALVTVGHASVHVENTSSHDATGT